MALSCCRNCLRRWPHLLRKLLLAWLCAALPGAAVASAVLQRADFVAAEQALRSGDEARFRVLAEALVDYPLYPYLAVAELLPRLDTADPAEVAALLAAFAGSAPAERLRLNWLKRLAAEGRWQDYVDTYTDNGSETRACLYRRALSEIGRNAEAFAGLAALYSTPGSLPTACDPLIAAWHGAGGLAPEVVWRRIDTALGRGSLDVARYQRRYLPAAEQPWLDALIAAHKAPQRLPDLTLPADAERRGAIVAHALAQLAKRSPARAAALHAQISARAPLPVEAENRILAAIGAGLVDEDPAEALRELRRIQAVSDQIEPQRERLQAGLRLQAWPDVAAWIEALPERERDAGEWQYWLGRALGKTGTFVDAAHAFARAAEDRSLWGFRAAELLGRPAALRHRPAAVEPDALAAMLASPTAARIRELQALGRGADINREWRALMQAVPREHLITAAAMAAKLGLHNEAILALAEADAWDDLDLRFPLAHRERVTAAAEAQGLRPESLFAVIRQESAFDADIASHAGAVGLMQLMPATAREVALDAGRAAPSTLELIDPGLNIDLGSRYLAAMRRRFDGHPVLATAAYNAGPGAVRRWLPDEPVAADLWIAAIPYRETKDYVRRVLGYRVIYAHRLGMRPGRVGALLRAIMPHERTALARAADP